MLMNPSLTSTLSEFSKKSDFSKGPLAVEPANQPPRRAAGLNLITKARLWLGKLVSFALARVLMIFFIGFAAGIAWQSYGGAGRKAIAGWSPHLDWVAPAATPAGNSAERLKAASLALAAVRQSVDRLTAELNKLQAEGGDAPRRRSTR
jgi:hypothetical protein